MLLTRRARRIYDRRKRRPSSRGAASGSSAADVVRQMTQHELEARGNQVEGRMKRKMLALRRLFDAGAAEVVIADGRNEHPVRDALAGEGTTIQ